MGGDFAIIVFTIVCTFFRPTLGDYSCICNYNVEKAIFSSKSEQGQPIGYMYEFDCKAQQGTEDGDWLRIAFEHQVGYIRKDGQIMVQVCAGSPPDEDIVTTTPAPLTTTLLITSTTTEPTSQAMSTDSTIITTEVSTKLSTATTAQQTIPSSTTTTTEPTTASITKQTIISTTRPITASATRPTTTITQPTAASTTQPATHSTTKPTTDSTTQPTTVSTTQPITATTTQSTTASTTQPTTATSTQPNTASTTQPTTYTFKPIQTTRGTVLSCHDLLSDTVTKDNGTLFAFGEKCLELLRIHTTWVNAELECRRKGGHLISIADSNEQRVIYQVINTYYHEAVWIGLHDMHHEEKFEWTSGKSVVYTNWYPGRKDPALHWTEDCVAMALDKYSGRWEDRSCKETRGFICQFEKHKVSPPSFIG